MTQPPDRQVLERDFGAAHQREHGTACPAPPVQAPQTPPPPGYGFPQAE
ncbi:hypothetical protein ACLB9X_28675 [Streptomyces sp. 5K101]